MSQPAQNAQPIQKPQPLSEAEIAALHIALVLGEVPDQKPKPAYKPELKSSFTVHYTQLKAGSPKDPLFQEMSTYLRELPRLLAEGYEGQYVLIKGEAVLGIFATSDEALDAGEERFPDEDFLAQPILEQQPVIWAPWAR
jgi:hypothetical protein